MAERDVIQYSRCAMVPTASSLAWQLGYLQQEAAQIEAAEVCLRLGDFEHATDAYWLRHAGTTKPLWSRAGGAATRAIAFSWHESSQPIYALPDSAIAAPADLRGRRIAMISVPNQKFDVDRAVFLRPWYTALASAGLALDDVTVVETILQRELTQDGAPSPAKNFFAQVGQRFVTQLLRGEVDAIATTLPPEVVRFHGLVKIYDTRTDPDADARTDLRGIVVSQSVIDRHRDVLVRLLARVLDASDWAAANAADTGRLLARDLNLDEGIFATRGIDTVRLVGIAAGDAELASMERKTHYLLGAGMLPRAVDVESWVDRSILRDAELHRATRDAAAAAAAASRG